MLPALAAGTLFAASATVAQLAAPPAGQAPPDAVVTAVPRSGEFAWEGFEREINWEAVTSTAATARSVDATVHSEGGHSLKLLFRTVADAHKAVYTRQVDADWSPYGALVLDVYNPTDLPGLTLGVVVVGGDWLDYEYRTPPLAKGWNRDVRVSLLAPHFSSALTDHRPTGYLVGRGDVKSLQLIVYPGTEAEGALYVDNLRLERAGVLTAGPLALNTTFDAVASGGLLDYVPPAVRIRPADLSPLESFETGARWPAPDGSGVVVEPATDLVSHGPTALSVRFPAEPDGVELEMTGLAPRLAGRKQLRMDVFCAGPGAGLTLILDGGGGEFTNKVWLSHGWNTRIFDLTNPNAWSGGVLTADVVSRLTDARVRLESRFPGRLVFDGLSAGDLVLRGAARGGALLSFAYRPSPDVEAVADVRGEDTYYERRTGSPASAGPEAYLDAANVRYDAGEFRTGLLYRKRINPMDQPMYLLVSPWSLGNEIAGIETSGRALGLSLQGLVASKIEYDRYNSRRPTGFGPEGVATIRARGNLDDATRLGVTFVEHEARYGSGVAGIPAHRETIGADLESHAGGKGASLGGSLEGGISLGAPSRPADANAPPADRGYVGATVSPAWGRLTTSASYTRFGYDFDGDLTSYGTNWAGPGVNVGVDLDGLPPARWLAALPLYDHSVANNLTVSFSAFAWETRDRYARASDGALLPRSRNVNAEAGLSNDEKARPNFRVQVEEEEFADQWTRNASRQEDVRASFPLPFDATLSGRIRWHQGRSFDLTTDPLQSGPNWKNRQSLSAERRFPGNLLVSLGVNFEQSRDGWEGAWNAPESHVKLTGWARQTIGPNSVVELHFGEPALLGDDYGIRDTIPVWTLTGKVYF